ncbi:MAG: protein translocase subunit SecF [Chloroflexota bacterium]
MFRLVQRRRYYFIFSGIIIGIALLSMIISMIRTGYPFRVGVDFQSGTRFEVQFTESVNEDEIRAVFNDFDVANPSITSLQGEELQNAWQVRSEALNPDEIDVILAALAERVAPLNEDAVRVESVSASVAQEVTRAAVLAIVVAAVLILLYIMFAFRQVPNPFQYGASAVIAMLHDLTVIFGFISVAGLFFGWEVDALFLTAALTVAGFSLQDTIVVFDRVRENVRKSPLEDFETLVNRSVLETIHRSLATQLNAMFVLVAIMLFGGASIRHFIAVLFIGLLSGTYSSIFNAVPVLVAWQMRAEAA